MLVETLPSANEVEVNDIPLLEKNTADGLVGAQEAEIAACAKSEVAAYEADVTLDVKK